MLTKEKQPVFKYYTLLAMLYSSILVISVLLDYRFITIGPMLASVATFIVSITFFLSDVIAEVYGYRRGRKVVWAGVICLFGIGLITHLLDKLPAPQVYANYAHAYHVILGLFFRACISNAIAIALGSVFNVYFISKWKTLVKGKYFWLRSLGSSAIGESLYTIFVVSLVNIGIVSPLHFLQILAVSYTFKIIFDSFAVIPASLLVSFLKRAEGVDIYDFPLKFTPTKYQERFAANKNSA